MKKNILYTLLVLAIAISAAFIPKSAGTAKDETVEWLTMEEAMKRTEKKPKKIFVDVYTDWCGWCKKMDKTTFSDPKVVKYLNKHYYAVKLDAESKADITIKGRTYKFKPEYKSHELAVELLQGRMSYPSTVYMDEKQQIITAVPGFMQADTFEKLLHFFKDDHYKTRKWDEFEKSYTIK